MGLPKNTTLTVVLGILGIIATTILTTLAGQLHAHLHTPTHAHTTLRHTRMTLATLLLASCTVTTIGLIRLVHHYTTAEAP